MIMNSLSSFEILSILFLGYWFVLVINSYQTKLIKRIETNKMNDFVYKR